MRASTAVFLILGLWLVLAPDGWGWSRLAGALGGEVRLLRFFVGFALVTVAFLLVERARMKEDMKHLLDALHRLVYGRDYAKHREAVDILIRALYGSDEKVAKQAVARLEVMTGQAFGDDPDAWREWWKANRRTFRLLKKADGSEPDDQTNDDQEL